MKEIRLMYGGYVKVDDEDFDYLNQYKWYFKENASYYYAIAYINCKAIYMHMLLIKKEDKTRILHINGDGLDNRKSNLRLCGYKEYNQHNPRIKKHTDEERIIIEKQRRLRCSKRWKESGKRSEYYRNRRKNDINFKIKGILYMYLWRMLKNDKPKKHNKILKCELLMGCDNIYLRKYIESQFIEGMNWNNHGIYGWQIDHIIPVSAFDLTDISQQRKCFHYSNLRPIWAEENIKKGKKY